MSRIDYIIGKSNSEIVRSRIASILALEFKNQFDLITAAISGGATGDELAELELSLSSIPVFDQNPPEETQPEPDYKSIVWEERFADVSLSEMPFFNVLLMSRPFERLQTNDTNNGIVTYTIESWQKAESNDDISGDSLASFKLQRGLNIAASILSAQPYDTLGFFEQGVYIIGSANVSKIEIEEPNAENSTSANSIIRGKLDVKVLLSEYNKNIDGVLLEGMDTTTKVNDSEKGYRWESNY